METGIIKHAEILYTGKSTGFKRTVRAISGRKKYRFHDQCLILFLVGEYTRISGDHFFYKEKKQKIAELQDHIEEAAYQPVDGFQEKETAFLQKISEWLMARFITVI